MLRNYSHRHRIGQARAYRGQVGVELVSRLPIGIYASVGPDTVLVSLIIRAVV
jgi:hypothetical protein